MSKQTKIDQVRERFRKNLPKLTKAGPTPFRQNMISTMVNEIGVSESSAPGVYNKVRQEFIESGELDESLMERGTHGRGLRLNPEYPWTAVLAHNNSPCEQFETKQEAIDWCEGDPDYAVKSTKTLLNAAKKLQ